MSIGLTDRMVKASGFYLAREGWQPLRESSKEKQCQALR
jgi:hypothetical protein